MSIEATFTMKRPNASVDFWWEATDPTIVKMRQKIDRLSIAQRIQRSSGMSADGRFYESRFVAKDRDAWNHFMNSIVIELPNMLQARNEYLAAAGHEIQFIMTDTITGEVIKDTSNPSWKLGE